MLKEAKIYVAGHRGLAGSAILRRLDALGYRHVLTRTHAELDLTDAQAVAGFFAAEQPDYVFLAAASVGGIHANRTFPAEFIHQNVAIQNNVLHQSHLHDVRRLLFLGSSCIYPALAPQPMREEHLMTGPLETTNQAYAVAKIAGIYTCWAYNRQYGREFLPVMPTNLYGPHDHFDILNAHVLPALIRKLHLATLAGRGDHAAIARDEKRFGLLPEGLRRELGLDLPERQNAVPRITLWGSGSPRREFLYSDDLAEAAVFLMQKPWERLTADLPDTDQPLFNIGSGTDQTIHELADRIAEIVGYTGVLLWDTSMPDGVPRKLLDASRMHRMGWQAATDLTEGLRRTYGWYLQRCGLQ
jgi:GDP-L-fucose synthase